MKQVNKSFLGLLCGAALVTSASAQNFVLPSEVAANEPFLFAATGTVEGTVVDVKTVEGEVVASRPTDKHGRVFLGAGLAAGSYILAVPSNGNYRPERLTVSPSVKTPRTALSLEDTPTAIDFTKFGRVEGNFPNPMSIDLDDFVSTRTLILAATPSEIVFDSPSALGVKPGLHKLTVRDTQTGVSATTAVIVYSAKAQLTQEKVLSGTQTHLVVTVEPKELEGTVSASINNGPVEFTSGGNTATMGLTGGRADFPLLAKPGQQGPFGVDWEFRPKDLIVDAAELLNKGIKKLGDLTIALLKKLPPTKPLGDTKPQEPPKKDEPKNDEPKKDDPPKKGGDTKATDNGWTPFKDDDGRTGKFEIKDDGKGSRRVVKIYDDGGSSISTTITGEKRQKTTTDTTTGKPGDKTIVEEVVDYKKNDKGEWVPDKGTRKTWKDDGKTKQLVKTETLGKNGWR
jgi:hypothetical protein